MYSGNHSPCHPLDTLLDAALSLSSKPEYLFCFVGGGSEQIKVKEFAERHRLGNIVCLPYQPLDQLSGSLSAADLHVVVMGNNFAGIVHPCKIYNIMTIGVPALYIGPPQSHVADLAIDMGANLIFTAHHGEHELVVKQIMQSAQKEPAGELVLPITHYRFSKHALLPQMINLIEFNQTNGAQVPQAVAELR
jgi:colanic acid biosynthesis glycosyl transferase WcaI